jgi:predicted GNAT superfamily acetyltransferase
MTVRAPQAEPQIEVRTCWSLAELRQCAELQSQIWGNSPVGLVPLNVFVIATHTGGQVTGAFRGSLPIGAALVLPAWRDGQIYLHSHFVGVRPGFRNRGIGRQLKLWQYQDASRRGVSRIEWTFDPLQLRNAYLNFVRLGVIARRYLPNFYGDPWSPLHGNLPTDRLLVEWHVGDPRTLCALADKPLVPGPNAVQIQIPANIDELRDSKSPEAERIQTEVREEFNRWFDRGYAVVGFLRGTSSCSYLLQDDVQNIDC